MFLESGNKSYNCKSIIKLTPGIACVVGAKRGGGGEMERNAKAKNGIPVAVKPTRAMGTRKRLPITWGRGLIEG